jgi:hypothetical protein
MIDMRPFHNGEKIEKRELGGPRSFASHESQPYSSESHVIEQDSPIKSSPTQVRNEPGIETSTEEKSDIHVQSDGHPEYPHGLKLATITVAVALSVFLVALVRTPKVLPSAFIAIS